MCLEKMSNIESVVQLAQKAEQSKDWHSAAELYKQAAEMQPGFSNWQYRRGLSLERAKRFEESVAAYQVAIEIDPRENWWYRLGVSAEGMKDFNLAKKAYLASLALDPKANDVERSLVTISPKHFPVRRKLAAFVSKKLSDVRSRVTALEKWQQTGAPKIFTYWDSGFDQAPAIVQTCNRRLKELHSDSELVHLNANTWQYYVDLPECVLAKLPPNKAHFSDVLRMALLARYGGIWLDATCLPTQSLTKSFNGLVADAGFFTYHSSIARISNWFFCTTGDNYVAKVMYEMLVAYWEEHEHALHYFVFHQIFEVLYYLDERFKTIWDRSVKFSAIEPHLIQKAMFSEFDAEAFARMYESALVHKLTYKFADKVPKPDLVVSHLVRGDYEAKSL
jgi:tetratricopeptide (TPR) repeat protein